MLSEDEDEEEVVVNEGQEARAGRGETSLIDRVWEFGDAAELGADASDSDSLGESGSSDSVGNDVKSLCWWRGNDMQVDAVEVGGRLSQETQQLSNKYLSNTGSHGVLEVTSCGVEDKQKSALRRRRSPHFTGGIF